MDLYARRIQDLQARRDRAGDQMRTTIARAVSLFDREIDSVTTALEKLRGQESSPEVLVRSAPGPGVTAYHAVVGHCRRVKADSVKSGRYRRMLEVEAKSEGLHRCSACTF